MESPSEVLLSGHKASHRDTQQEYNFGKVVSTTFPWKLLEQVRKYLPLLLFFCISKQIFRLFYVGTFPLALSAVFPMWSMQLLCPEQLGLLSCFQMLTGRQLLHHTVSKGHVLI